MQSPDIRYDPRSQKLEQIIELLRYDHELLISDQCLTAAFRRCNLDPCDWEYVDPILERAEMIHGVRWYDLASFELDTRNERDLLLSLLSCVMRVLEHRASLTAAHNVVPFRKAGLPP